MSVPIILGAFLTPLVILGLVGPHVFDVVYTPGLPPRSLQAVGVTTALLVILLAALRSALAGNRTQ